jgi:hypothetical protein
MKTWSGEGPRRRWAWVLVGVAALLICGTVAVLVFRHRRPQVAQPVVEERKKEPEAKPPTVAKKEEYPPKAKAVQAPPPLSTTPVTETETERYLFSLRQVRTRQTAQAAGKVGIMLSCNILDKYNDPRPDRYILDNLNDPRLSGTIHDKINELRRRRAMEDQNKDPDLLAVVTHARVTRAVADTGEPAQGDHFIPTVDDGLPESHYAHVAVDLIVPERVGALRSVEGVVTLVRAAARDSITWSDFAASRGQWVKRGEYEFAFGDYSAGDENAEFSFLGRVPRTAKPSEPQSWQYQFVRWRAKFTDGSFTPINRCHFCGLPDGKTLQFSASARLNGRKVAAFEVQYIPAIALEEVPFRFENIALPTGGETVVPIVNFPVPKTPASATAAPRGRMKAEVEGYAIVLCSLELRRGEPSGMMLKFQMRAPAKVPPETILRPSVSLSALAATLDTGLTLNAKPMSAFFSLMASPPPFMGTHAMAMLPLPPANARRIASLKGAWPVGVIEEQAAVEFAVGDAAQPLTLPAAKGPVTINSFSVVENVATVNWTMDTKVLPDPQKWNMHYQCEILDTQGKPLNLLGWEPRPDAKAGRVQQRSTYAVKRTSPTKFVVRYNTKFRTIEVPFDFQDVPLPQGADRLDLEKPF